MSALEQEIFDRFKLLDKDARQRVILQLQQEAQEDSDILNPMSPQEGLDWLRSFGAYIHKKYGDLGVSSVDLLDEAREERMNDLMGGR
jgi:hypothetical protein